MSSNILPEEFADLEHHTGWALPTETERRDRRRTSDIDALRAFYDAVIARVPDALQHLNRFPLADLPEPERRLLQLCFSFAEVAPFVEQYRRPILPEIFDETRMVAMHDHVDAR